MGGLDLRILDFAFSPPSLRRGAVAVTIYILAMICTAEAALAANYVFLSAPEIDLNRVYRLDSATGEVGACQYGLKEGTVGVTLCYPPGEGAGPQPPSDYSLVASHHEHEGGVFRVDQRTGMISICYVLNEAVVCTPQAR